MQRIKFEDLPKEKLAELARMYAHNWQTLDGLWFKHVETEFGLPAAEKIDLRNWEKQSVIEAQRIKKVLGLEQGGLSSVLTVLSFMSWQVVSPSFEFEQESPQKVVFFYPDCPIQEGRKRMGKADFSCKTMKTMLLTNIARVAEPRAKVRCLSCPPDPHPQHYWCKWELTLEKV